MRILSLAISNLRGIEAVEVNPDGKSVVVKGRNGDGKTSVLDAIRFALTGSPKDVRQGETRGDVEIVVGDYMVRRKVDDGASSLTVERLDGGAVARPSEFLRSLVSGGIAIDPVEFSRCRPQDRIDAIAAAAGVDMRELDIERDGVATARKVAWQGKESARGAVTELGAIPDGPDEEPDVTTMLASADALRVRIAKETDRRQRITATDRAVGDALVKVEDSEAILRQARLTLTALKESRREVESEAAAPEGLVDQLAAMNAAVAEASGIAKKVGVRARWREDSKRHEAEHEARMDEWRQLGADLDNVDARKAEAAQSVTDRFPGVEIKGSDLMVDGVPFPRVNNARQIEVGLLAGVDQGKIRIALIDEASTLDDETFRRVLRVADHHDVQLWLCRISNEDPGLTFEIVEGEPDAAV